MAGYTVNFEGVLYNLSDEGFSRIKIKVIQNRKEFPIGKINFLAQELFEILCEPEVMDHLDRKVFAKLPEAFFLPFIRELTWFAKYCKTILEVLKGLEKYRLSDRASSYYNHLKQVLIPEFITRAKGKDHKGWDFLDDLVDIYKSSACLLNYLKSSVGFTADVTRGMLDGLGNAIFDLMKKGTVDFSRDERVYAKLFTWILTEIIFEQDGITSEAGEEE